MSKVQSLFWRRVTSLRRGVVSTGGGAFQLEDSVKSTVTVLEESDFTEEGGGFNWRGCFSVGGYHYLWRRGAF